MIELERHGHGIARLIETAKRQQKKIEVLEARVLELERIVRTIVEVVDIDLGKAGT